MYNVVVNSLRQMNMHLLEATPIQRIYNVVATLSLILHHATWIESSSSALKANTMKTTPLRTLWNCPSTWNSRLCMPFIAQVLAEAAEVTEAGLKKDELASLCL